MARLTLRLSRAASLSLLAMFPLAGCRRDARPAALATATGTPPAATALPTPQRFTGASPAVAIDPTGGVHVAYVRPAGEKTRQILTRQVLPTLGAERPVGTPADVTARGEVGPLLAAPGARDLVLVYTAANTGGRWSSDLWSTRSADGGATWSPPHIVQNDSRSASHSYADLLLTADGTPLLSWLDNRSGHQGVQAAVLDPATTPASVTVDDFTCECCRTSLLRRASGEIWLAYRDHADGDVRNVAYAASADGGRTFARRGTIADDHWVISGCPDSGPRLTETADGVVWAAWFNGATKSIQVAAADARGFGAPAVVAQATGAIATVNHPEIGTLPDGRLVLFYERGNADGTAIVMQRRDRERGGWEAPVPVAEHATGPRYTRTGDVAALALTRRDGEQTEVLVFDAPALGALAAKGGA